MILLLLIGLALIGTSFVLVLRAAAAGRVEMTRTLNRISSYGYGDDERPLAVPSVSGRLGGIAAWLGESLERRTTRFRSDDGRGMLQAAGIYRITPRQFVGYRLLATGLVPALWLWFSATGGASPIRLVFGCLVAGALGWTAPVFLVKRRIVARLAAIDYDMPELIDLLVTTVEAGIGFGAALRMAARRMEGPLGQVLQLTLREQEMGLGTREALSNMLERADTPAMRAFVRAVLQGETLGVSIGKILRDLAHEMRQRRRQAAEERAQKAPTKMLFPLIFLIFPAMFLVLLGPAGFEILKAFRGG